MESKETERERHVDFFPSSQPSTCVLTSQMDGVCFSIIIFSSHKQILKTTSNTPKEREREREILTTRAL